MPLQETLVGCVLGGIFIGLGGAVLYSLGIKKASYLPTAKAVAIHGLFSYCFAYAANTVFNISGVSWFLFAALVAVSVFVSAIRLRSIGARIEQSSNQ